MSRGTPRGTPRHLPALVPLDAADYDGVPLTSRSDGRSASRLDILEDRLEHQVGHRSSKGDPLDKVID